MTLFRRFKTFLQRRINSIGHNHCIGQTFPEKYPPDVHPTYFGDKYVQIAADNSCFFNAVVKWFILSTDMDYQRYDDNSAEFKASSFILRSTISDIILKHPNLLLWSGDTIEENVKKDENLTTTEYADIIADSKQWAGMIEVEVTSLLLKMNIIVYQLNPSTNRLEVRMCSFFGKNVQTMYLYLNGWGLTTSSHFSLLWKRIHRSRYSKLQCRDFFPFFLHADNIPVSILQSMCTVCIFGSGIEWIELSLEILKYFDNVKQVSYVNHTMDQKQIQFLKKKYLKTPHNVEWFGAEEKDQEKVVGIRNKRTDRKFAMAKTPNKHLEIEGNILIMLTDTKTLPCDDLKTTIECFEKTHQEQVYFLVYHEVALKNKLLLSFYPNGSLLYQIK